MARREGKQRCWTSETCAQCHEDRVEQFKKGKHAAAWAAMNAMPTAHWQPMQVMDGMRGCGGCHKIGLKSPADMKKLKKQGAGFGVASCDACHTRHTFSAKEAAQPQACQTCHMQDGDHEVRTAWGFLAVRLPMPKDKPTGRLDVVKAADVARLDQKSWQVERDKMLKACGQCHSSNFAKEELAKGDEVIRQVDHLMAEAIREVAGLFKSGALKKPKSYSYPFPDLLTFHDAPTPIENQLFVMFLKHRMRAFQGAFHANPDYALWYGWSEMQRDLTEIKAMAAELRAKHK